MIYSAITKELAKATWETLYITILSFLFSYLIGLPLGVILNITGKNGIAPNKWIHTILGLIINILRSIPFLILMVFLIPFTRLVIGTSIGTTATILPLVVAASPFVARMVESSLNELDSGKIEAGKSMGATHLQIIFKILIPESIPSLLIGGAISITTILGYSAMAGFVGGGGLGDLAINYGYYQYNDKIMWITIILLVIIVQILQELGMRISKKTNRKIKI